MLAAIAVILIILWLLGFFRISRDLCVHSPGAYHWFDTARPAFRERSICRLRKRARWFSLSAGGDCALRRAGFVSHTNRNSTLAFVLSARVSSTAQPAWNERKIVHRKVLYSAVYSYRDSCRIFAWGVNLNRVKKVSVGHKCINAFRYQSAKYAEKNADADATLFWQLSCIKPM